MKKLLELRKKISEKRPDFVMQDHHKRKETKAVWRRPKGMHSKMRHGVWGRPASVNPGYRGPAAVRGLHKSGLEPILVHTTTEIESMDAKTQGAIIAHVGQRNKLQILEACKKKGVTPLNVKSIDEEIKKIATKQQERKEAKKTAEQKREIKAVAKKEEKKEEVTKEQERKEMEKIITKRE